MAPESIMHPWSGEVTALVEAVGHEHWIKLTGQVWSHVWCTDAIPATYRKIRRLLYR